MSKTDEQLWADLHDSKNRSEAFKEIYERYSGPLFRFAYRFTAHSQLAEDTLHDVFSEILKGTYREKEAGSLKSWLFTVTKNKSLNCRRKLQRETLSESHVNAAVDSHDLERSISQSQLMRRLVLQLEKLPHDLRETWQLRQSGLDYQEIATKLEIPVGTVKSRFNRLVTYLKEELK